MKKYAEWIKILPSEFQLLIENINLDLKACNNDLDEALKKMAMECKEVWKHYKNSITQFRDVCTYTQLNQFLSIQR